MSHKRREQRQQQRAGGTAAIRWAAVLRAIVLGGVSALLVVTALIPSEGAIADGSHAPLLAGWCLLLVIWAISLWFDPTPTLTIGWTEAVGVALVGWYSLAALVSLGQTNGRQALNAHWLFIGYGLTAFLVRQAVRRAEEARGLVAAMIWLATLLASLGLYQYAYGMPRLRRDYERDAAKVLEENGIPAEADSPQRVLFENRLQSVEPLGTFALANSLAGFLAPWLIAALAVGLANFPRRDLLSSLTGLAVCALIMGACLVLTKSRTAFLATIGGLVLLGVYGRRSGWRLDWRIPAATAGVAVLLGLAAVWFGGLDVQVLSEAPKSVLYRVEYWQATARVIGRYPLFGSGPGNFQEAYAAFKLPQASETIADPHNFLLEIWATAGTPALLLLLALGGAFVFDLAALARGAAPHAKPAGTIVAPPIWVVWGGAVLGLLAGPWIAGAMGYPLEPMLPSLKWLPVIWLLGLVLFPAACWLLRPWIERGELTVSATVSPVLVLLVNLLAAGALTFPGVVSTLLVLAPLALFVAASSAPVCVASSQRIVPSTFVPREYKLPKAAVGLVVLGSALLVVACLYTEYYPVLNGRRALSETLYRLESREFLAAENAALAAAQADAVWPEPWRLLAELRLSRWQASGAEKDWKAFVEVADAFSRLDPRHHLAWFARGNWFLTAWRKSGRREQLDEAIAAYKQASLCYPNRAFYHAQLAWALQLAGQTADARREAELALELDEKMPHKEQRLNHQHVADSLKIGDRQVSHREESAEQTVQRLRSASAESALTEDKP